MKTNTIIDGIHDFIAETISRTIYVTTTGNDITGDGSIWLPFATIGKAFSTIVNVINRGVTITINVGIGTFTLTSADNDRISTITGYGQIDIVGAAFLAVDTGFTKGAFDANDPLKFAVTGGNSALWTTDQWKFYWVNMGSSYYPITNNTTTSISSTRTASSASTGIYSLQTIINMPADFNINVRTVCTRIKFVFPISPTTSYMKIGTYIKTNMCDFYSPSQIGLTFDSYANGEIEFLVNMSQNIAMAFTIATTGESSYNYFYGNAIGYCLLTQSRKYHRIFGTCVFENINTGVNSSGWSISNAQGGISMYLYNSGASTQYYKFMNCVNAFRIGNEHISVDLSSVAFKGIILINTSYLIIRIGDPTDRSPQTRLTFGGAIFGTPTVRYFNNSFVAFCSHDYASYIKFPFLYPEFENNLSASLADNATTNVIIGNKLQNQSIFIDYSITRGATFETGRIKIQHDGSTPVIQDDTPLGDVGVTFAVDFNTNEIRLAATLTSTGTAATMKYNVSRVMITPLTI